jgi:hypothetical protein
VLSHWSECPELQMLDVVLDQVTHHISKQNIHHLHSLIPCHYPPHPHLPYLNNPAQTVINIESRPNIPSPCPIPPISTPGATSPASVTAQHGVFPSPPPPRHTLPMAARPLCPLLGPSRRLRTSSRRPRLLLPLPSTRSLHWMRRRRRSFLALCLSSRLGLRR